MKADAIDVLLALAVAAAWIGAVGVLLPRSAYDRLHAAGYVAVTSGTCVTLAVVISQPVSALAVKALLVLAALLGTGVVLVHAIGRSIRIRDQAGDRP